MRGDELTGFHSREAGRRGGRERRLRLKMRLVRDQRTGWGDGDGGADEAEGERGGAVVK